MAKTLEQIYAESGRQSEFDRINSGQSSGQASGSFGASLDEYLSKINEYSKQLEETAQDNFDFITKFLDKQHKVALGQNDQELAKFYEDVANDLEARVGRIPFDFQQRSDREKRNLQIELRNIANQKRQIMTQAEFEKEREAEATREEFNRRGLLASGIQKKQEEQQQTARQIALRGQLAPLERREELAGVQSTRNIEDITTQARRDAQDFQLGEEQKREGAQLDLDQRLAEIRRQKEAEELSVRQQLAGAFQSGLSV